MKKVLLALSCASLLFANNYDLGLQSYKNDEFKKAHDYFLTSAKNGNSQAAHNLSIMYNNADGVDKNIEESIKWLKIASDSKNPLAMTSS